ncbi:MULTISPECIES: TetR/AcrR family transcriptional regulator [unclassified Streptomyces]|uniref:TetR/AcrR family transcriptional regulator n=1 Tax=unclassified Streptomyces TaxID=2593676 RepID=UPI000DD9FE73|nr:MULTISPECIES: TetR/AcrR family transcriptional regulator [unclassified Streptomyces]QZZ25658.1 TetR family transcriptional regulator [Streptomyces sp. ST1015]
MGRWEPNACGRLAQAALELFGERGYEQTTVAEIARRAGLTERTYFRHYADKCEVMFDRSGSLQEQFVTAVAEAPQSMAPIDAVAAGLEAVAQGFADPREYRRRQAVIAANAELQERELTKYASMSAAIAEALRRRGVPELSATLAAEAGITVFKVGFQLWLSASEAREMSQVMRESLDELKAVTARRAHGGGVPT